MEKRCRVKSLNIRKISGKCQKQNWWRQTLFEKTAAKVVKLKKIVKKAIRINKMLGKIVKFYKMKKEVAGIKKMSKKTVKIKKIADFFRFLLI